jgi:hypothetical protein
VELAAFFAASDRLRHLANPLRPIAQAAQGGRSTEPAPDITDADALAESPPAATRTADRPHDGPTARLAPDAEPPDGDEIELPKGTQVCYFGDYELRRVLGRGGMERRRQAFLGRPAVALSCFAATAGNYLALAGPWAGGSTPNRKGSFPWIARQSQG